MNSFLSHKKAIKLSYRQLAKLTDLNREYIRVLITSPGNHKNITALILIGKYINMDEFSVRAEWKRLRRIEVIRRVEL